MEPDIPQVGCPDVEEGRSAGDLRQIDGDEAHPSFPQSVEGLFVEPGGRTKLDRQRKMAKYVNQGIEIIAMIDGVGERRRKLKKNRKERVFACKRLDGLGKH